MAQILAEKLVLEANGVSGLQTVALRPSAIFGEGDPIFVPTVIRQVRDMVAMEWETQSAACAPQLAGQGKLM